MSPSASGVIASNVLLQLPCALSPALELWWVNLDAYSVNAYSADTETRDAFDPRDSETLALGIATRRRVHACHQALRDVLAKHYGCSVGPEDFARSAFGKPRLRQHASLHFNISHTEMHGLIGVSTEDAIGVDIERLQSVVDANVLAARHFTATEQAAYYQEDNQRGERFLTCWTRKEACSKALGVGLSFPPALLEVGCGAELKSVRIPVGSGVGEISVCSVLTPGDSIAAVSLASTELEAQVQHEYRLSSR